MLRKIITIDETKCDGCGNCVPECHEGALQIIDGKARLISDLFCDGLGACIGFCPAGALVIEEREAEPYNEKIVMATIVKGGSNVIKAHLEHLRDHGEFEYLTEAKEYMIENKIEIPALSLRENLAAVPAACSGSQEVFIKPEDSQATGEDTRPSHLRQWPIQFHLVSPFAQYYRDSNLLLAADCCGFVQPDLHSKFLKGKSLAIACPKLDSNKNIYLEKLTAMINDAGLKSITVLIMQVPCCGGLAQLAVQAISESGRQIPLNVIVLGTDGSVLKNTTIN